MIIREILDFLAPRYCVICGRRLAVSEEHICTTCLWHLPRTNYHLDPYENELAKVFWGRIPIVKASAWFFYKGHSEPSRMILDLKYNGNKEIGKWMGRVYGEEIRSLTPHPSLQKARGSEMIKELESDSFFKGIDYIMPVPITWWRRFRRGYNQSLMIAEGISEVTGIPIIKGIVKRRRFSGSQTRLNTAERVENVRQVFMLTDSKKRLHSLEGKHILLVDDVITTGSTIAACAEQLAKIPEVKISIMSIGRTEG